MPLPTDETKRHLKRFRRETDRRPAIRLQDRDRDIIKTVYDFRFLSTPMIHQLLGGSERGVTLRLQKLFHNRYVDRIKLDDTSPIVYALGNKGADELTLYFGIDRKKVDWTTKNREVGERYVQHSLMIARFRLALVLALRDRPDIKLDFWEGDRVVTDKVTHGGSGEQGRQETPIVPDAFFALRQQTPEGERYLPLFLEADRSTMSNERFLDKLRGYYQLWQQKIRGQNYVLAGHAISAFRVLVVTISELRKQNLRATAKDADPQRAGSALFWFVCEKGYAENPARILDDVWQTARDDNNQRLV